MVRTISRYLMLAAFLTAGPLSAQIMVTNTSDSGPGSLRDAILQSNASVFLPDIILFSIPGPGVHTITLQSPLPALTDPVGVHIDGLSQPGAGMGAAPPATATLLIELDGSFLASGDGISIQSDFNIVQGLVINRFPHDGIRIVGGVANLTADFNIVSCNFVGTDASGTVARGNGTDTSILRAGIHISNVPFGSSQNNLIDVNLVSDNWSEGVWSEGPRQPGIVGSNSITNNYIGTDVNGTSDLGNKHEGVTLSEGTTNNQVLSNLISGNDTDGVGLQGFNNLGFPQPPIQTSNNLIAENVIGLDVNGNPLPNLMAGVAIGEYGPSQWGCSDFNTVRANTIAFNGGDAVSVHEDLVDNFNADGNEISQNSTWKNGGLGIDLENDGVSPNDKDDSDTGPNQGLNFPLIAAARFDLGQTTITGTIEIDSSPKLARVEVFKARRDPTGHGEGEVYLGSATPDGLGRWKLVTNQLVAGDRVTATVTDVAKNTSEFSAVDRVRQRTGYQQAGPGPR